MGFRPVVTRKERMNQLKSKPGPRPLPPGTKKQRITISVDPDLAKAIGSVVQSRSQLMNAVLGLIEPGWYLEYNTDPYGFIRRLRSGKIILSDG